MHKKLFGTDGVRGVANKDLTGDLAYKIARAGLFIIGKNKGEVIIGKDTRTSGDMLESALVSGACSLGWNVKKVGIVPTPVISFLVKKLKAQCGIMISASHNPVEDNGIKLFDKNGFKLSEKIESKIEDLIYNNFEKIPYPPVEKLGKKFDLNNARENYFNFLKKVLANIKNLKIALDCANGAATLTASHFLKSIGATVIVANTKLDGIHINKNCGSLHPEVIQKEVLKNKADLGIAFDGDADRLVMIDEKGNILNGDDLISILALFYKEKNKLKNNLVVLTVMSNLACENFLKSKNIKVVRTPVGDRLVVKELIKRNGNLGGEQAGHIILLDYYPCSDGLLTALEIIKIMQAKNKKLSELTNLFIPFPQVLINVKVRDKNIVMQDENLKTKVNKIKQELGKKGRILLRHSGTEPKIRIMLEGEDKNKIEQIANNLAEEIKQKFGG